MKTIVRTITVCLLVSRVLGPVVLAGTVTCSTIDSGGRRVTNANYTMDGSVGGIGGISSNLPPSEVAKHGYIGQLTDVSAVVVTSTPPTVDEVATRQADAIPLLDDDTILPVLNSDAVWSVLNGPLAGVSASGLVTAQTVYTNEPAWIRATYQNVTGQLALTVLNTLPDNYGSYAGDSLPDQWQVDYFGIDNPDAAPGEDPDVDTQTNYFEYVAHTAPTNRASFFCFWVEDGKSLEGGVSVMFSPRWDTRQYTVRQRTNLTEGGWSDLTGCAVCDEGQTRTVSDTNAMPQRFYRVDIVKP